MRHIRGLLLANTLFHFSRMFSGAVFVVILIESSVSLSAIALAKGIQLASTALLMVPSGIFADKWGRKNAILVACAAAAFYYGLLIEPSDLKVMVGEALNGVAIAFYSGAFESWLFSKKQGNLNHEHSKMLSRASEFSYLGMVGSGLIGSVVSPYVFQLSFFFMIGALISFSFLSDDRSISYQNRGRSSNLLFRGALKDLWSSKSGIYFFGTSVLYIGFMQLIYQFWQPYYTDHFPEVVNEKMLGTIFCSFMLTQYLLSKTLRSYFLDKISSLIILIACTMGFGAVSLTLLVASSSYFLLSVTMFCALQSCGAFGSTVLRAFAGQTLEARFQATSFSIVDFGGRLLGAVVLSVTPVFLAFPGSTYGWQWVIVTLAIISLWGLMWKKECGVTR
jgi:MFS family permease